MEAGRGASAFAVEVDAESSGLGNDEGHVQLPRFHEPLPTLLAGHIAEGSGDFLGRQLGELGAPDDALDAHSRGFAGAEVQIRALDLRQQGQQRFQLHGRLLARLRRSPEA